MKKRICIFILVFLTAMVQAGAEDSVVVQMEFSDMYNERGFYNSNAIMADLNEIISEYNGNLSLSFPLFQIKGKGGMDVKLALNYNGSMGYTVINRNDGALGYQRPWFNVNGPGWILSLNGIAVQVFNFESAYFSKGWGTGDDLWAKDGDVCLLNSGYHYTDNISWLDAGGGTESASYWPDRNIISLMMGDGSDISLFNPDGYVDLNLDGGFVGEYQTTDHFGKEKALVWYQSEADQPPFAYVGGSKNRFLNLYRGDGTIVHYFEQYTELYLSNYMLQALTLQQFYPTAITDNKNNTIGIHYSDVADIDGNYLTPNYKVIGHPLLERITIPGVSEAIEFEYVFSPPAYEALFGLVIRFQEHEYLVWLRGPGESVVDFPFVNYDAWKATQATKNNHRDHTRSPLGLVTKIVDPEGRAFEFEYQTYHRKVEIDNQLAYGYTPPHDLNSTYKAAKYFDNRFGRINKIIYPEGRVSTITYWENEHGSTDPNLADLQEFKMPVLFTYNLPVPAGWYMSASPYLCDPWGNGGIGRDAYFNNIVFTRTVKDGVTPVRKDEYDYTWTNFQYGGNPSDVIGYKSQDYQDLYTTTHKIFSFDAGQNARLEKKLEYKYRTMPYKNRPRYSQDVGSKILLKSVANYNAQGNFHDSTHSQYFGEAEYIQAGNYFFTQPHLEKTREEQFFAQTGSGAGAKTWQYTLAEDSLTFKEIRSTDRRRRGAEKAGNPLQLRRRHCA